MRVAFDVTPLERDYPLGVRRATRGLFDALSASGRLELEALAPASGENERHWRHRRLPRLLEQLDVAGLHSPISAFPHFGPGRRVQTIHELPWRHGCEENADLSHRFWARFGPWRADAVLCPTDFVRGDLLQETTQGHGRIHHCPWGLEDSLGTTVSNDQSRAARPFLLAPGAVRPKKQLAASLRALAESQSPRLAELRLFVTGPETESLRDDLELAKSLGLGARVRHLGQVSDAQLTGWMSDACAVLVLSNSEGFGFPVIEAQALGTPAIVARETAQAEVAGPLAHSVNPTCPQDIALAIEAALDIDGTQREALRQHAASYSWRRCARQVEELWLSWDR